MKKAFLVTGVSGSGKTTICEQLIADGYEAYNIEDIDGMFKMYHKDTGKIFKGYDNADPEQIKNARWICDTNKLKKLLKNQKTDSAFYCGIASNMEELIPLFDKLILLKTSQDILYKRLLTREGTEDMGATEESRQAVLGWKDWWENEMLKKKALMVNADGTLENIVQRIIKLTQD